ncbi:MAG: hypothetical protein ABJE66_13550 [Deltaproteobacteria bacterium]
MIDGAGDADKILADLGAADVRRKIRAMDPRREVVRGALILAAGLVATALYVIYILYVTGFAFGAKSSQPMFFYSAPALALSIGAIIVGTQRLVRGLRARDRVARARVVERA